MLQTEKKNESGILFWTSFKNEGIGFVEEGQTFLSNGNEATFRG